MSPCAQSLLWCVLWSVSLGGFGLYWRVTFPDVGPTCNDWFSFCHRICHCEGDDESPLITPCHCTGSLHFVHQSCLQQWIKSSDTRCCELCKYEFIMETKLKPLRKVREEGALQELASQTTATCLCWFL